jgi:hypothetical protein
MTWTANLDSSVLAADGRLQLSVTYSDGVTTVVRGYVVDGSVAANWLQQRVRQEIAGLTTIKTLAAVAPGPIDATAPADPALDAATVWFADFAKWRAMQYAVNQSLIPAGNAAYVAQTTKVKANFVPAYLDDLRFPRA